MDLSRLISPQSIAVIGGGAWGENVIKTCRKIGFEGEIWPVHPKMKPLAGHASVASISDLPAVPDAAYICVNRHHTIEALRELAKIGAGGAVCFASGFKEAQAEDDLASDLEDALLAASGEMPLIGPNCYGFINYVDRVSLWPDQQGAMPVDQGVAIFTQSSNIALNMTMLQSGLPISHIFTVGNQAKMDMATLAMGLVDDPRVRAFGLHIEGIKDLQNFEQFARAAHAVQKPIIVLKVGKSTAAQQAAISHTASLAGSHRAAEAFFERLGSTQVNALPAFVETLKLAYQTGYLPHGRIASMSCSGGEASLISDLAEARNVTFPPLSQDVKSDLGAALGSLVALANPLDYHTYIWRDEEKLTAVFCAMAQGDHAINLVVLDYPRHDRCEDDDWIVTENAIIRAKAATDANFGVVATFPDNMPEPRARVLNAHGIVPFAGLEDALIAIEALSNVRRSLPLPAMRPKPVTHPKRYEEAEAKARLAKAGIAIPKGARRVSEFADIEPFAKDLSFPLVLKGEGVAHKSEVGAVVLGIKTIESLKAAMGEMDAPAYLIEAMIADVIAEIIIGVTLDPAHGYLLTIGAGGILTEILNDTVSLLLPVETAEIDAALERLRIAPVLRGFRGKPAIDRAALIDTIMTLQDFVYAHHGDIEEIEINPLLLGVDFAIAGDALIIGDLK